MTNAEIEQITNKVIAEAVPEIIKQAVPEIAKKVKEQLTDTADSSDQNEEKSKVDYTALVKNALN